MATANVLSANVLKQITGISAKQYKKVAWHTAELVVRQFLDVHEYMNLIHQILSDCKKPDGSIAFELIDFSCRVNIVATYAMVELPEKIDDMFYIMYGSDLYDTVIKVANGRQISSIYDTVRSYAYATKTVNCDGEL